MKLPILGGQDKKRALVSILASMLASILLCSACTAGGTAAGSGSAESATAQGSGATAPLALGRQVVIGTMVTEDILPMWVAESEGIFTEVGVDATVQTFQSAQELSTAVASGAVDLAMTDIMVSATLTASGTPVSLQWVTLGTTSEQGRFGIMTSSASGIKSLKELAGVPIGVGSCTVPEYVMDKLMEAAGVAEAQIVGEEIKKVPVRYEMMASNQVAAAALPGSLLALGEATGMVVLADDSKGANLSQSVMIVREDFASASGGVAVIEKIAQAWDNAVERINANPESYRALLIEKAQLPEPVRANYPISSYPSTQRPSATMVNPVLDWMLKKGYLESQLTYSVATGTFVAA